ncbi:ABC transporter substrate-binding protein [Sulfolobus sp. A20]|uniref:ABC transporter substrate-binding protein n=1 Tax=Saccharolobus sp. A20 TaxID=1891280 RepID=UPI0008461482|nr:ABC transporter substrate-binding protein [Sulfolobus sp. A20]TRM74272.1 ABC transporter substrate-binding protein [Sulfolobus sp. E5]TRM78559.1 ABC transporter substrate-binding protein [Sulfolobus sp. A20-N-F8]TRM86557.1 ABC transporter substrate-binding protein [Sulfolobus sp. C3]TRM98199.1 ABC transporter substrate-binding protein [Sulfolobus sp. E1]TRN00694.1 ABC transporter substrate-binding protein [Sulfolobus sp. F1]
MEKLNLIAVVLGLIIIVGIISAIFFYYGRNSNNSITSTEVNQKLRIVSLAPSDTQILISLGLGKYIVGIDYYSYQLLKYLNMTSLLPKNVTVFSQITPPNVSGLLLLHPTVVVVEKGLIGNYVSELQSAGINVFLTNNDFASSFSQIEYCITKLGEYFNQTQNANKIINWMNEKVSNFSSSGNVTVGYLLWICPNLDFYTAGGNVFISSIITLAGGVNVFANYSGYPLLSADKLIVSKPSIIIAQEEYNLSYTNYLISQYPYINKSNVYIMGNFATSLFNEPGPLSVYSIEIIHMIITGSAPKYINYSWVMAHLNVTLPVY